VDIGRPTGASLAGGCGDLLVGGSSVRGALVRPGSRPAADARRSRSSRDPEARSQSTA